MSTPKQRMRQPGRLVAPYDPGNCQVCDPNKGIPNGTLGLSITGAGYPCCSIDIDSPPGGWILTPLADACQKDLSGNSVACSWQYTLTAGGVFIQFTVTISCQAGVPTVDLSITQVDSSGAFIATIGTGSYTLAGTCGTVDCSLLSQASGTLTLHDGSVCQPAFGGCANPAWAIIGASVADCPADHANECCCGGGSRPCYYACFTQKTGSACCLASYDLALCLNPATGAYEGTFQPQGCSAAAHASLTYDASAGFTLSWNCGGSSQSLTFPSGSWGKSGGQIQFCATDVEDTTGCCASGSTFDICVGGGLQCQPRNTGLFSTCCTGPLPAEIILTIPDGIPTHPTGCDMACNYGGAYVLEYSTFYNMYVMFLPSIETCGTPPVGNGTQIFLDFSGCGARLTFIVGGDNAVACYGVHYEYTGPAISGVACCDVELELTASGTISGNNLDCVVPCTPAPTCRIQAVPC